MPSPEQAQEASISILKNEIASMHKSIDVLSGKMDRVMEMNATISVIQEQHNTTKGALDRAFSEIKANRNEIELLEGKVAALDLRATGQSSSMRTSIVIATLVFGIIQTYYWRQLDVLERTAERQVISEQRLAGAEQRLAEHLRAVLPPPREQQ